MRKIVLTLKDSCLVELDLTSNIKIASDTILYPMLGHLDLPCSRLEVLGTKDCVRKSS